VLCIALDHLSLHRNLELYRERQRAETQRARADQLLANVLPARVVDEIKHAGRATARRIDNLGVLFADIVGFTRYASELPPQAVVLVLDEIFCAFDELAQRHGVEKIKTIGDAYMAVSESGAAALCRVALEMRQALERYNAANGTRLSMRIGIHAGPAVAGVLGVQRFLYDVWGDTVNVASRLEGGSQPGSIQVSEPVVRQAGREFSFTARGPVELEGRGSMNTWWLLGTAEAARRPLLSVVGAA